MNSALNPEHSYSGMLKIPFLLIIRKELVGQRLSALFPQLLDVCIRRAAVPQKQATFPLKEALPNAARDLDKRKQSTLTAGGVLSDWAC